MTRVVSKKLFSAAIKLAYLSGHFIFIYQLVWNSGSDIIYKMENDLLPWVTAFKVLTHIIIWFKEKRQRGKKKQRLHFYSTFQNLHPRVALYIGLSFTHSLSFLDANRWLLPCKVLPASPIGSMFRLSCSRTLQHEPPTLPSSLHTFSINSATLPTIK